MYLESLKIFCDVVRLRSFSRAAAANRITQSAASQNVLQLEKGLGVRLLDRSKRPFQLTPEGRVYFDGCKGLIERYYAVEAEVKTLSREVSGTVTVAAIYSVGLGDMSQFVQEFAERYPKANVRLAYLHPDRVYESVVNEEADIGLLSFPRPGKGLTQTPWRDEPMVVACSPRHPLAQRQSIVPAELDGEELIGFDSGLTIRKMIDRYLKQHHAEVKVVLAFDNIETIKHAVEVGQGVAILPEPTLRKEVMAGSLVAIPFTTADLVRPLGILQRKNGHLNPTAQKFIELMLKRERHDAAGVESDDEAASNRSARQKAGQRSSRRKKSEGAGDNAASPLEVTV